MRTHFLWQVTPDIVNYECFVVNYFDMRTITIIHGLVNIQVVLSPFLEIFEGSGGVYPLVIWGVEVNIANV